MGQQMFGIGRTMSDGEVFMSNDSTHYILSGWKQIANYLGTGIRTAQRYEIELQLPVRRPSSRRRSRGPVMATRVELDAWVNAMPLRERIH